MNVAVIGAGYVGLVTGAGLAHLGHRVRLGETNPQRVAALQQGETPIFEEGLPEMLQSARDQGRMTFHQSNLEAAESAELIFLCLPTPPGEGGRADLSFIEAVVDELAPQVAPEVVFVVKSTVPPGTVASLTERIAGLGSRSPVVSHPEFLREGKAVSDFLAPDRLVVGANERVVADRVLSLYDQLETEHVVTDPTSAEMIKYASNSYLAARLTFVNTLANLSEVLGADIIDVTRGMGLDKRIGPLFLQPGPGYGGSCFPKDTSALIGVAEDAGYQFDLLRAVVSADDEQRQRLADKIRGAAGGSLRGARVAMWGVAFKAGTDDVRESPALKVAALLQDEGAEVVAYDPEAVSDQVAMAGSAIDATSGADVLLVATEWPEFALVDMFQVGDLMKGDQVVDARNLLDPQKVRAAGLGYLGLGRPRV